MAIRNLLAAWFGRSAKTVTPETPSTPVVRPEEQQRLAKINQTDNPSQLLQMHRLSSGSQRKAIEQRLAQLLLADGLKTADIDRLQAYVLFAGSPELREQALDQIQDQQVLANIAREHNSSKLRQLAANRLTDVHLIEMVADTLKQKDQGLYKQLRQRLDAQAHAEKELIARQQRLDKLCQDLEAHSRSSYSPLYPAKLQSLQQQWTEAANEASPALIQRFQAALQHAQNTITEAQAQQQQTQQAIQTMAGVIARLTQTYAQLLASEQPSATGDLAAQVQEAEQLWLHASQTHSPETLQADNYQQLKRNIGQQLKVLDKLDPHLLSPTPESLTPAQEHLTNLLKLAGATLPVWLQQYQSQVLALAKIQRSVEKATPPQPVVPVVKAEKKGLAELNALLDKLHQAIEEGQTREASQHLRAAHQHARQYQLNSNRLTELTEAVQKLKDWEQFAILPKKEVLLAQMTTLADTNTEDGLERQAAIRALQDEWNALGMVHSDEERALWQQFKEQSQKAWEPCKRYFDQQRQIEEANGQQRQALCDELQSYLEQMPTEVNWQRHVAILATAREQWQRHHPVSHKQHRALQPRFNQLIKALEEKLHQEYARQSTRKQELIEAAAKLLEAENAHQACQQAKQLQQQWKATGTCGHQKDQQLWEQFRQHCDALFAKRDAARLARQAAEQEVINQAKALLTDFEQALNQNNDAECQRLYEAFQSLQLPREQLELRQQLVQLHQRWQQQQQDQANAARRAEAEQVLAALEICWRAEEGLAHGRPVDIEVVMTWNQQPLPERYERVLANRWQQLIANSRANPEQQQAQFRTHCLLLEMLLELPSPAEEQSERIARQMAMFQQQSYPRTQEDRQKLIDQTIEAVLACGGLPVDYHPMAHARLVSILAETQR